MAKRECHGRHAKLLCLFVTTGGLLCLGPIRLPADDLPERSRVSPPPPPTIDRDQTASVLIPSSKSVELLPGSAQFATRRASLQPLLVRDRRHRLLLKHGKSSINDGKPFEAIAHFQALLDAPQDAFFWNPDSLSPRGARSVLTEHFRSAPNRWRQDYEHCYGATAKNLLAEFNDSHDVHLLTKLVTRYGHTDAARHAAIAQLYLSCDTGRTARAHEWSSFLKDDPYHWAQTPFQVKQLIDKRILCEDKPVLKSRHTQISVPSHNTQLVSFETTRDAAHRSVAPYPVPVWTARFDAGLVSADAELQDDPGEMTVRESNVVARAIRDSYDSWLSQRTENGLPVATAHDALVAGEVVIIRDFTHVRALSLRSGREHWRFACKSSLARTAARSLERNGQGHPETTLDFHAHFSGNSVFGQLSTDGNALFLLDSSDSRTSIADQLIALPLKTNFSTNGDDRNPHQTATPLWQRGTRSGVENDNLSKCAILGCPLSVDDRLYLLAEFDQQINLFALDASTGRTLWKQAIALVDTPVADDVLRRRIACTPLYYDGIVCCPSEVGIVVGVDALTGRLKWACDLMDEEQRRHAGRWAFASTRSSHHTVLPGHTYLVAGRLYSLPVRSRFIHCIEVADGNLVWKQPRSGAHAIGGVTDNLVLLLGDRECRAISTSDGATLWKTSTPEPAGIGIVTGHRYLFPTTDGPCLTINLRDGLIEGQQFAHLILKVAGTEHPPSGNLRAYEDSIVATTSSGVRVFDQAQRKLERLTASATQRQLSPLESLLHAQLLMIVGDDSLADSLLQQLVQLEYQPNIQQTAGRLLREVLYASLEQSDNPGEILSRITRLAETDEERLRLQRTRLDVAIHHNDGNMLVQAIEEIQDLPDDALLPMDRGGDYAATAFSCMRDQLASLLDDGHPSLIDAITTYLTHRSRELMRTTDEKELRRFVCLFAEWPQSAPIRDRLARVWAESDCLQQAELLLLAGRDDGDSPLKKRDDQLLTDLYSDNNLPNEAGRVALGSTAHTNPVPAWKQRLTILQPDISSVPIVISAAVSQHAFGVARSTMRASSSSTYKITEHRCLGTCTDGESCKCQEARSLRGGLRRAFVPRLTGSIEVLDAGFIKTKRTHSRIILFDRETGGVRNELAIPSAYWQLPRPLSDHAGHVLVIGGEAAHGISLLEGKTLWSFIPNSLGKKSEKVKIGPQGSDYCVIQTSRDLRVVHPATGRTLWKRTHLPRGVGLLGNEATGIIGDSRILCVFDDDQSSYTLYRTQSGRKIREGTRKLPSAVTRRNRWAVGRRLVESVTDATGSRLRIWDCLNDRLTFDIPLTGRLLTPLPGETEFACLTADERIQIIDAANEQVLLDEPVADRSELSRKGNVESLRVAADALIAFSDRNHFYVNFVGENDESDAAISAATDQSEIPHVRIRGRLLAFDRYSGQKLWSRLVNDSCVPIRPDADATVLTLMSRMANKRTGNRREPARNANSLVIEVLEADTGNTVAQKNRLLLTKFVHQIGSSRSPSQAGSDHAGQAVNATLQSSHTVASLVGLDSRIDIHTNSRPVPAPVRVATGDPSTVER